MYKMSIYKIKAMFTEYSIPNLLITYIVHYITIT